MRLLMIAPRLFPLDRPSVGAYYLEHAIALKSCGVDVSIINVDLQPIKIARCKFKKYLFKKERYNLSGVEVVRINGINIPKVGYFLWVLLASLLVIGECWRRKKPNVILAQRALLAGSSAKIVKLILGIPYVVIEHFSGFMTGSMSCRDFARASGALKNANAVAAVSEPLAASVKYAANIDDVAVIPNVVRTDLFVNSSNDTGFNFVTVSNLDENKRTEDIIHAFKIVNDAFPHTELRIVGEGKRKAYLEGLSEKLGLSSCVKFYGALSKAEVANVLSDCHCFVLASEVETFGVVIIEALSSGLPVISSSSAGAQSIMTEDFLGRVVATRDVNKFSQEMFDMVENYELWDSSSGKRRLWVENCFSPEVVGEGIKNWINHIIQNKEENLSS